MNPELLLTLDDSVEEVLGILTGLDLVYDPSYDRYRAITRQLNRALRANALEHEWSYYHDVQSIGEATYGTREMFLDATVRPRIINDDSVRFVDDDGVPRAWAYFLPRDALHKYNGRRGLWCSVTRDRLDFSRGFNSLEAGLQIQVPVMREPTQFRLPAFPEDPDLPLTAVPAEVRNQPLDFQYPDVIVARAAWGYAMTDPVMQPRAQTLESMYKDLMYQAIERDDRNTDTPYQNEFILDIQNGIAPESRTMPDVHAHPHAGFIE